MSRTESRSLFKQFCQSYSLNNLASLWYSILTTLFQIYIIIRAIYRFSAYISLPWPNGQAPQESINFYLLFIATSILIVPFFIISSWMKVGNYSNDGRKLGLFNLDKCLRYLNEEDDADDDVNFGHRTSVKSWAKIIWKHSLPIGPILHLLMAVCFLLPRLMTDSQMIRHGFLNKSAIWKTDLDFVLKRFNGKIFDFFGLIQTINRTEHQQIFADSSTLGQYFIRNSKSLSETFYELDECGRFSPEFLNLIIALVLLTTRYPAVFWRVSKPFSLIMTFQLVLNSVQSIIAFNAFEVAFKIFVCDPTHLLIRFRESSSLNLVQLSTLMIFYIIVLQFSSVSLYVYGLHKYREYRYARTKYFQSKYENILLVNLLPYLFAMIFFIMLALSIGPLFVEFAIIYCGSLSISALLLLISTIVYFMFWILLWLILATKTVWNFHYEDIESSDSLLDSDGQTTKQQSSILITNNGKIYKVKDNLATMAIVNFIQSNSLEKSSNKTNGNSLAREPNHSFESYNGYDFGSRRFRHSARNSNQTNQTKAFTLDRKGNHLFDAHHSNCDDSEGEYTTFYRLKRTYSLNQKRNQKTGTRYSPMKSSMGKGQDIELTLQQQNQKNQISNLKKSNQTTNVAYGLPPLVCNVFDVNQDRISDISSGFHSNTSDDLSADPDADNRSDSLESLMQKLDKAAEACRPTTNNLMFNLNLDQTEPKMLSTFTNNHSNSLKPVNLNNADSAARTASENCSKLIEFVENPDYSKYYLPHK